MTEPEEINAMLVYAVEGFAKKHRMKEQDVLVLFKQRNVTQRIASQANMDYCWHTDMDENIALAEELLSGNEAK
jgi:hypothetical protein